MYSTYTCWKLHVIYHYWTRCYYLSILPVSHCGHAYTQDVWGVYTQSGEHLLLCLWDRTPNDWHRSHGLFKGVTVFLYDKGILVNKWDKFNRKIPRVTSGTQTLIWLPACQVPGRIRPQARIKGFNISWNHVQDFKINLIFNWFLWFLTSRNQLIAWELSIHTYPW